MHQHLPRLIVVLILVCLGGLTGCSSAAPASVPSRASARTETPFVWPTLIPTQTSIPNPTRTASPLPSLTPTPWPTLTPGPVSTLNATQIYQREAIQVTAARRALDGEQDEKCIQLYDRLLTELPDWGIGYYNRGVCKRNFAHSSHDQGVLYEELISAIDDQNRAISLGVTGNSFVERGFDYLYLREALDNSAEEKAVLNIALDNLNAGVAQGATNPTGKTTIPLLLIALGRCREGVDEASRQSASAADTKEIALADQVLATGYLCLGQYRQALTLSKKSLELWPNSVGYRLETAALTGLGELDEALKVINQCIQDSPNFEGYRYYQRALIYYDKGEPDLAFRDLQVGSGNTWYHGGLFAYLMGVLALDNNQVDDGTALLKYAAASLRTDEGPWLMERIQAKLADLKTTYQTPTPAVHWEITPLPNQPFTPTPKPN